MSFKKWGIKEEKEHIHIQFFQSYQSPNQEARRVGLYLGVAKWID